jgi:hypothetical protein
VPHGEQPRWRIGWGPLDERGLSGALLGLGACRDLRAGPSVPPLVLRIVPGKAIIWNVCESEIHLKRPMQIVHRASTDYGLQAGRNADSDRQPRASRAAHDRGWGEFGPDRARSPLRGTAPRPRFSTSRMCLSSLRNRGMRGLLAQLSHGATRWRGTATHLAIFSSRVTARLPMAGEYLPHAPGSTEAARSGTTAACVADVVFPAGSPRKSAA